MTFDTKSRLQQALNSIRNCLCSLQKEGFLNNWQFTYEVAAINFPHENLLKAIEPLKIDFNVHIQDQINPKLADPSLVQVKADMTEMKRRISAFISRKRMEVDEINLQEFCSRAQAEMEPEHSCARVDAVMTKRTGNRGHVKVSRVVNQWGPQTDLGAEYYLHPTNPDSAAASFNIGDAQEKRTLPPSLEERIQSMESHLHIKPGQPVPKSIYTRLKFLEDRILQLEGMSPEYFSIFPPKRQRLHPSPKSEMRKHRLIEDVPISEINARLKVLRQSLRSQQKEFEQICSSSSSISD